MQSVAPGDSERAAVRDEVLDGKGLSFPEAAKLLPSTRAGRPVNAATVWRWALRGVRLPDGRLLRLGAVRVSGHYVTSVAAIGRFIDAQQSADYDAEPAASPRPPGRRQRASDAADGELKRRGC
jgi:hypothetical protein